ncbi:MAG: copper chaperone PCu(A)C [Pseudomonadota bacterium]
MNVFSTLKTIAAAALISAPVAFASAAHAMSDKVVRLGDLVISTTIARATAPGARVGGAYATIENTGTTADRLIGGSATFAGEVQIHEMKMVDNIMKMNQIEGGLEIPPGETVKLKPGGNHIMLMKLGEALKEGETRKVTLTFEKAGSTEIEFMVKSVGDTLKMKHNH